MDTVSTETKIPSDIESELRANGVWEIFIKLAPSHQQEYLTWITSAKKEETRISRIAKMCEMLQENIITAAS